MARSAAKLSADPAAQIELTILMPCLNEAETLAACVTKAKQFFAENNIIGEVLIADNGSTDGSQKIAEDLGARVVAIAARGYGAALKGGIVAAKGHFIAMGDADDSYDFLSLYPFIEKLRAGADLVMGNRFWGGIAKGAMPPLHRYLGNPVLSFLGRLFYDTPIGDFHCGLRAFRKDAIVKLGLNTDGMEFASEMVVKSALSGLKIEEAATTLVKDGRSRPPHLRSWRDGWRHLKFLLTFAPRFLFLYPGLLLLGVGLLGVGALGFGDIQIGNVELGVHSLLFSAAFVIMASQILGFAFLARLYGAHEGYWPLSGFVAGAARFFTVERAVQIGVALLVVGLVLAVWALGAWGGSAFGPIDGTEVMRHAILSVLLCCLGLQSAFTGFFAGLLMQKRTAY